MPLNPNSERLESRTTATARLDYTPDDYVDLEPDEVRAGCDPVSHIGDTEKWRCRWCGESFVIERGDRPDCPFCPNRGGHKHTPVVRYEDN